MFTYAFSIVASILFAAPAVGIGQGSTGELVSQVKPDLKASPIRSSKRSSKKRPPVAKPKEDASKEAAKASPAASASGHPVEARTQVEQILDSVQKFYGRTSDLKAKFTQTYTYKVYGRTQVSRGRVFFKKPGMMRWDYREPVPKVFVADGEHLWIYEPQENQYFKRALKSSQLPIALSFMTGRGDLAAEFDVKLIGEAAGAYTLELLPKQDASDYQSLILEVETSTFAVRSSTVIDPVGNTNQLVFDRMVVNSGLPDSGFKFKAPEGVREVKVP